VELRIFVHALLDNVGHVVEIAPSLGLEGTVRPLVQEVLRFGHHAAKVLGVRPVNLDPRLVDTKFAAGGA